MQSSDTPPTTPRATRQPATSATNPVTRRPVGPPSALPAMSRPTAPPSQRAATSRVVCAMASAGSAASATPCNARRTTSTPKDGANGSTSPSAADTARAAVIIRVRPHDSHTADSGTTATASARVVADSARLAVEEETANSAANVGRSACGL